FAMTVTAGRALAEGQFPKNSVVELFTSQGCSSCPAADRLLQQLAQRPDIIAMSLPVTYWDYLGWRDTLAKQEFTQRQRDYASARGDGEVYTPQVVVNGLKGCVGSDLSAIESAVRSTAHIVDKEAVGLQVRRDGSRLIVDAGSAAPESQHKSGKVFVAAIARAVTVPVGRGENAGRTLTYTNVVRKLVEAGQWQGAPTSYAVSLDAFPKDRDMLVVFLQADHLGPIVGAARIDG
ncbi:MAG TPA: DUF1223 domain-containing protein, partial [Hyphomicrobiales bacterium]|nr:DUF1223 domain-containing protein [Hyphomicrobiales bacterium]